MYHVINRYGPAGAPVFSLSAVDVDAVPAEVAARPGVLEHLVRRAGAAGLGVERGRLAPEVELVPAVEPDAVAPARAHASHAPLRPRRRAPRPAPRRQVAPRPCDPSEAAEWETVLCAPYIEQTYREQMWL